MRGLAGILATLLIMSGGPAVAEPRIAVASNFRAAAEELAATHARRGHEPVALVFGSSGRLYAQILNGAPYDAFLSADSLRPGKLEEAGLIITGTRFTYAEGRLVLWSPQDGRVNTGGEILTSDSWQHLAIANPRLAPYGLAAEQVLQKLGLLEQTRSRLIMGENINQAFQFVLSGNAELGLVADAQLVTVQHGSRWDIPVEWYSPIEQQAVQLTHASGAGEFLALLASQDGREIIRNFGYGVSGAH